MLQQITVKLRPTFTHTILLPCLLLYYRFRAGNNIKSANACFSSITVPNVHIAFTNLNDGDLSDIIFLHLDLGSLNSSTQNCLLHLPFLPLVSNIYFPHCKWQLRRLAVLSPVRHEHSSTYRAAPCLWWLFYCNHVPPCTNPSHHTGKI